MAETNLTVLDTIVQALGTATGYTPHLKGGNINSPLEYSFYRTGLYSYRLEVDIRNKDIRKLYNVAQSIHQTIGDIGDTTRFPNCSIAANGGGTLTEGSVTILILYFDVTSYEPIF